MQITKVNTESWCFRRAFGSLTSAAQNYALQHLLAILVTHYTEFFPWLNDQCHLRYHSTCQVVLLLAIPAPASIDCWKPWLRWVVRPQQCPHRYPGPSCVFRPSCNTPCTSFLNSGWRMKEIIWLLFALQDPVCAVLLLVFCRHG